jgi:hypothetical protein
MLSQLRRVLGFRLIAGHVDNVLSCSRIRQWPTHFPFLLLLLCAGSKSYPPVRAENEAYSADAGSAWSCQSRAGVRPNYGLDVDNNADKPWADYRFEALLTIAETPQIGETVVTRANGTVEVRRGDMVDHRRLQIDAGNGSSPARHRRSMAIRPRRRSTRTQGRSRTSYQRKSLKPRSTGRWGYSWNASQRRVGGSYRPLPGSTSARRPARGHLSVGARPEACNELLD